MIKSILNWHVNPWWILFAFGFEPLLFFSFTLLYWLRYDEFLYISRAALTSSIAAFGLTFMIGLFRWGLAEEIGWRGWLFPKLQSRMSPFMASIALAVVISFWHIHPTSLSEILVRREGAYLRGYFFEAIERLIITIPITLLGTFIFNNTNGSLFLMMIFMFILSILIARPMQRILQIKNAILMPIVAVLCAIGSFSLDLRFLDIVLVFLAGLIGLIFKKGKYPPAPLVLGIILGPLVDTNFRRALKASGGDFSIFFTRPVSLALILATVFLILGQLGVFSAIRAKLRNRKQKATVSACF